MITTRINLKRTLCLAAFALTPALAQAHHIPTQTSGFMSGLNHPLLGLDHVLAMVAGGLWAAQLGGKAIWRVPAAFVCLMAAGGALGMSGVRLPMVETGIAASILILGVFIAAAVRLPVIASMAVVGLFALFHGHAHGAEIPNAASGITYAAGFILATALLHAVGIGAGLLARQRTALPALRFAGGAIAFAGICLWFS